MRSRNIAMVAAQVAILAAAVSAWADAGDEGTKAGWAQDVGEGKLVLPDPVSYPGVDPQTQTGVAPAIGKAKKSKKTVVTWPGFQMVDGGSRVFVQLIRGTKSGSVEAPARLDKAPFKIPSGSLVYAFPKKVVLLKNNLNPLVTRGFNTPVDEVRMKRKKGIVYMLISLRAAAEPVREELVSSANGLHYFFVEFAAGSFIDTPPDTDDDGKTVLE